MNGAARAQALAEMRFCEDILAKAGLTVLTATLGDIDQITAFDHYPKPDVFDPVSGGQWFYHCHPAEDDSVEHGHFHCFVRPDGPVGPIHHLVAIGCDAQGRPLRLFTVNQWVVEDNWLEAEALVALLPRFDMQMPQPSYLVNRWLTAIFVAYAEDIAALIRKKDYVIKGRVGSRDGIFRDRSVEVLSEFALEA